MSWGRGLWPPGRLEGWSPARLRPPRPGGTSARNRLLDATTTPALLGAAGILAALICFWVASIFLAAQHVPGLSARDRIVRVLYPSGYEWAFALLLGVALVVLAGGRRDDERELTVLLLTAYFLAACTIGAAAVITLIVDLTEVGGQGPSLSLSGAFAALATLPVAAATALWARQARAAREEEAAERPGRGGPGSAR